MSQRRRAEPRSAAPDGNRQARAAWDRALRARAADDPSTARRWLERAQRLVPNDPLVRLTLGALLLEAGEAAQAAAMIEGVAREHDVPAAWVALASCHLALGAERACAEALEQALRLQVPTPELAQLMARVAATWPCTGRQLMDGLVAESGPVMRARGFVAAWGGGLRGFAWHAADPAREPRLVLRGPRGERTLVASDPADGIDGLPPLARPRGFSVTAAELETVGTPVRVTDALGHALLGSPVDPGAVRKLRAMKAGAAIPAIDLRPRAVDVVIPVHGGAAMTLACLDSVLASVPDGTLVHVVDDASPHAELADALDRLTTAGRIVLHRHTENRGFPAAANTGLRAAAGRDVVLLNSDTLVPPGWLGRLRQAAYSAPEVGSATPLSNEASIVSYPVPAKVPDRAETEALDRIAQAANAGLVTAIPVGVGFCLYLRRDCMEQVGPLREDVFAQGYGEENDFCLRASGQGWRHVAALDVFVGHAGGGSFGDGRVHLQRRNAGLLNRLHPGYDRLVAAHVAADPLFAARRRMDALRWQADRAAGAVVLVTHAQGGGVAEFVAARAAAIGREGKRAVVLRPVPGGCAVEGFSDLRFAIPAELGALAALLRPDRPSHVEVHHLLGHDHGVLGLAALLGVPIDTWVHDWAHFCPRINLIGREGHYCGEPEVAGCERCVGAVAPRALRARSAAALAASRRIVVATEDGARRLRRHFPEAAPEIVPWEDERGEDERALPKLAPRGPAGRVRIVVVGAIAVEKGFGVLLDCARDARRRELPLEFVVCGFTEDDELLMAAGEVFVTGRYAPEEAVALIRRQRADLAFVPSVCPETWCYGLSRAWQAGLAAVSFDLGAQAGRIRATGRGTVLPLALPVAAINDALLRLARSRQPRQCPQP